MQEHTFMLALVGNPNAGKSSVFNRLTGLSQKTGNFPGVTVDRKTGEAHFSNGQAFQVADLPGTYSLHPTSADERIVLRALTDPSSETHPDAILYMADVTNLERHLLLCTQCIDLGFPIYLALTMPDLAEEQGLTVNLEELSKRLGIPVFWVNGRTGEGLEAIKQCIWDNKNIVPKPFFKIEDLSPDTVRQSKDVLGTGNAYSATLQLQHADILYHLTAVQREGLANIVSENGVQKLRFQVEETMSRFDRIVPIVKKVIQEPAPNAGNAFTAKIDRVLTHRIWGTLIFMGTLLMLFQATFDWASYPMDFIEMTFVALGNWFRGILPEGFLTSLFVDGILSGLSGVLVFVPQIAILFMLTAVLEESGYMARAVYLSDSLMRKFGLNGRSMVSLFSGMACAVPAIMATRSIGNWRERLLTIMVTPLVSCSARIPVYTVLIAFVVPENHHIGLFNLQGLVMMGLYLLGIASALFASAIFKMFIKTREPSFLAMELPPYKRPDWKNVGLTMFEKVKTFVVQAGKVILLISIVLWFLASFGPPGKFAEAENEARQELANTNPTEKELATHISSKQLEVSYIGYLGKAVEPIIRPLGFDWKIGIALIASFAAREVFVGTMATIYSVEDGGENTDTLRDRLKQEVNPVTHQLVFTPPVALSLLMFYVFAMQCMSTMAVVKRETKSWKWPLIQLFFMSGLAYLVSLIVYQLLG